MLWLFVLVPLCGVVTSVPQSGGSSPVSSPKERGGLSPEEIAELAAVFASLGGNSGTGGNAHTTTSSPATNEGDYDYDYGVDPQCGHPSYDCVAYFQCVDGEINTDGAGVINIRLSQSGTCVNKEYPDVPALCCHIPGTPTTEPPPTPVDCDQGLECVDSNACNNDGNVVTDGSGLINIRSSPYGSCWLSTGDVGVCCAPPLPPTITCPSHSTCVAKEECFGGAYNDYDEFVDYVTGGSYQYCDYSGQDYGVCCVSSQLDYCPGSSVCVTEFECVGKALTDSSSNSFLDYVIGGTWEKCKLDGYTGGGICCEPPVLDSCPYISACVASQDCLGAALENSGSFSPYHTNIESSYSECKLAYGNGVCCEPPYVIDQCPDSGKCVDAHNCNGDAMDYSNTYVPATESLAMPCRLDGSVYGVCCKESNVGPAGSCGVLNARIDTRIVAPVNQTNYETRFGEIPWQAIIFGAGYSYVCGASLISDKFLLTAAHCIDDIAVHDLNIRLGEWQVNTFDEQLPYIDIGVQKVTLHPKFKAANVHNDIAVIELKEPVPFAYHINSICLPPQGVKPAAGTRCVASGWGKNAFEGTYQHVLKKVGLPFVPRRRCQNLLRKTRLTRYFKLDRSFVCAGGEHLEDVCEGDGGGPLACLNESTGQYELVGITSWGIGCGTQGIPGVYANVPRFVDWVNGITGGSGTNYG